MDWIAIAGVLAALLALGMLSVALLRARTEARRFGVLEEIAGAADRAEGVEATLAAICDVLVPEVADFCLLEVISAGRFTPAATRVGARVEGVGEADLRALAEEGADPGALRALGMRSAVTAPLRARGKTIGRVTFGSARSRRHRAHGARFARVLAGRLALTLDNAGLFSDLERAQGERAEIAATLQRGLMPPPLPEIPGWRAAAMYRPAGAENKVGGDFYDAFPVAGGWMLVIGDVTGRGARAASITAQARYTLRAAAWLSEDPLVALAALNRALLARPDAALCTVVAFALPADAADPVGMAVAGHLPPLLVDGDTVSPIAEAGPVLGAFGDASWSLEEMPVRLGQQLVAVTDGITEASGRDGRFGEARLRAELGGAAGPAAAVDRLEAALRGFSDGPLEDDAAALVIARSG